MWAYYLKLGVVSLRRNPVLTLLMVLTLGVGVSASMTTLTILHGMSGDPIPNKSDRLFVPLIDNYPEGIDGDASNPPEQLTYRDTVNLWKAAEGLRKTPVYGIGAPIDSGRADLPPFFADGVAVGRDFFAMFDVPWLYGQAWSEEDDDRGRRVAVLARSLSERLFGADVDPTGQRIRISDGEYAVVGVIDTWQPLPKFYRLVGSDSFGSHEEIFLPFAAAIDHKLDRNGNMNCNEDPPSPGFQGYLDSECTWMQLWVELDEAGQRDRYMDFLTAYVGEQKKLGRLPRPLNNRLHNVREWMDELGVVEDDTKTATWLAFGFLLVCLVNTTGLLLAKFSARPGEIGVRRALGASRGEVFRQYLTESAVIGAVGAGVGLALTLGALAYIRSLSDNLELLARLDLGMAAVAIALAVFASLMAGLLPTWRACQVVPALQLKSQ